MFRARRSWLVCSCLVLALAAVGCGDDDEPLDSPSAPTNPTPPTNTTPPIVTPPQPTTFTISGRVTESAPTTFVRLEGVRVTLSNGASRTTNANGDFEFADVATGNYEVRAEKSGYSDQVRNVNLSGAQTVNFELTPGEALIERTDQDSLSQDSPSCSGSSKPCRRYDFGVHHNGTLQARLEWVSSDANLDMELVCNERVIATAAESGNRGVTESMETTVNSGQRCELRIYHLGGPEQRFTLDWSHPN